MCFPFRNCKLPLEERINDLISRLTLEEKIGFIPTHQAAVERLGIKEYQVGGEAAHGLVSNAGPSTVFPQPIGLSCTWDPELMQSIGDVISDEARVYYQKNGGKGGLNLWSPTIDMARDPRWGRTEEAYGEDPYLTGRMSSAFIKGIQGDHPFYLKAVASPKHFYGNNNEKDRLLSSSSIDPRNKNEYYLKAFKPAFVEGKAYSMMTAYNAVNGRPCIVNPEVQTIVKDKWGCQGFIVSDGGAMSHAVNFHKYYKTYAEVVANAIKNGIDVMTDDYELVTKSVKEAIDRKLLSEKDLDKALRNILRVRFKLGQFDSEELNPYANISESVLCCKEHAELSLKASHESIVLLKNKNNFLPLDKNKIKKIAVIGPLGNVVYRDWYTGIHPYKVTPLEGIKNKLPHVDLVYVEGNDKIKILAEKNHKYISVNNETGLLELSNTASEGNDEFIIADWGWGNYTLKSSSNGKYVTTDDKDIKATADEIWGWYVREVFKIINKDKKICTFKTWNDKDVIISADDNHLKVREDNDIKGEGKFRIEIVKSGIDEAIYAAKNADVAIVFLGNHPLINGKEEIDRQDIILAPSQENLLKAVYETNPNTILVVVSSYPVAINWANKNIPAILFTAHGAQELGNAVADVLFGDYSPAGRLNMTWYKSINQLTDIMDYDIIKGKRTYMYFEDEPLYCFGHGLTYTEFHYSNLKFNNKSFNLGDEIIIRFTLENVGTRESDEVSQMYVSILNSKIKRPIKELKGFKRIHLKPGEKKEVSFSLPISDLSFWDVTRNKYSVESGSYKIMIGRSSCDIKLWDIIDVKGETIPSRDLIKLTKAENYDDYNGVLLGECKEGGDCVTCTGDGDWIMFNDVDFKDGVYEFEARVSSVNGGVIDIRIDNVDGTNIGICNVPVTGDNQSWETVKCIIHGVKGTHKVYFNLKGNFNMSWFKFIQ
ncbi:hypothetical protein BFT35_07805 [Thermoanaerobacterium thermosaccharolyticum]|uniref:glycoside hydrolase family 3 protein n=1 Tax=Thermoanaerobacterium thermosaccharolyticum TaxID=1517 RepID=UPI000C081E50|nr:glycoside hydrolase family 3 protein [Thermoanaerobacterium thermosaccharolyticum]PHO07027.1 hypothetical protein BFT35_07805 [Thermoanaerobacterium thermosaccharolyticum]